MQDNNMSLDHLPSESASAGVDEVAQQPMPSAQPALYHDKKVSAAIRKSDTVLFVMNEAEARVAEGWGYVATCLLHTPYAEWYDEYADILREGLYNADVVGIPVGNDGTIYMAHVALAIKRYASSFAYGVIPKSFGSGASLSTLCSNGGTKADLDALVASPTLLYETPQIVADPTDIKGTVDACMRALLDADVPIYQRDGRLVTIQSCPRKAKHGLKADPPPHADCEGRDKVYSGNRYKLRTVASAINV